MHGHSQGQKSYITSLAKSYEIAVAGFLSPGIELF